jgi:membrane dipeptidase
VQASFVPWFLTRAGADANAAGLAEWDRLKREMPDDPDAVRSAMDAWFEAQPTPPSSLTDVADHIDHIRDVAGVDAVGIGSDFDGVQGLPDGLGDVSRYPALFEELSSRGYGAKDLSKIAGRNVLRVMREAERVSSKLQDERPPSTASIALDG